MTIPFEVAADADEPAAALAAGAAGTPGPLTAAALPPAAGAPIAGELDAAA